MPTEDDGLAPPPPLQPRAMPIRRTPDLADGTVRDGLTNVIRSAARRSSGDTQDVLASVPTASMKPAFTPFKGTGPDPLTHIDSVLEEAVGSDPSLAGTLKAVFGSVATSIGRPVASITDLMTLPGIQAAQKQFLGDHDSDLRDLSRHLGRAKRLMLDLGQQLQAFRPQSAALEELMAKKRRVGSDVYSNLLDSINDTTDPDERQKLEAQKAQMDTWLADRDARIAKEQPQVDELRTRVNAIATTADRQSRAMTDAGWSEGPTTLTGSETPDGPNVVLDTTHTRPDAVRHVASLRAFLVQSRIQMNGAFVGSP